MEIYKNYFGPVAENHTNHNFGPLPPVSGPKPPSGNLLPTTQTTTLAPFRSQAIYQPTPLTNAMKAIILSVLHAFGMEVKPYAKIRKAKEYWIAKRNINTVIDIGASSGDTIDFFLQICKQAQVYGFEPQAKVFAGLQKRFATNTRVTLYPFALGEKAEEASMHTNAWHYSSSLLPFGEASLLHYKQISSTMGSETVHIRCLDAVLDIRQLAKPILVKIDVQGFEDRVIRGGLQLISGADVLLVEMGIKPGQFGGECNFHDLYTVIHSLGFSFKGVYDQDTSLIDGEVMYLNAIFFKA
ncbi:MAG: hypothetical protein CK532_02935 [Flavobacteriales bacterium]|nr:MAG: hypothetical protein CK532_02935 [Flavobacteriales bacterium]